MNHFVVKFAIWLRLCRVRLSVPFVPAFRQSGGFYLLPLGACWTAPAWLS
jgi:hypothetical protein